MHLDHARIINVIRHRLTTMATVEDELPGLRARVYELASDLEALVNGDPHALEALEPASMRDTTPAPPPAVDLRDLWLDNYPTTPPAAPAVEITRPTGGP